ncbi:hypothetical protein FDG2_4241 [Candidatus Protofrankia californiensis]|uniref:Uncharacterized protein n=1 Tax=Candidatus Protofrankia californiensis TaxID=1839754 RepID=A0A1C3P4N0_9ACTN|nr:hypothetical protein FDG2_4241 [Candidatus Protofrankia californiensis]
MKPDDQYAARHRLSALSMLAKDAAYDQYPMGDPPLLSSDLRRALLAVLALTPERLLRAGNGVTEGEAAAFLKGQQAALDAVHTGRRTAIEVAAYLAGQAVMLDRVVRVVAVAWGVAQGSTT